MLKKVILFFIAFQIVFYKYPAAIAQKGNYTTPKVAIKIADSYDRTEADKEAKTIFFEKRQPSGFNGAVKDEAEKNIGKGDFTVNIQVTKTWSYSSSYHYEGELKWKILGSFGKIKGSQPGFLELFEPIDMALMWTYQDKVTRSPRPNCLALVAEHAGSGSFPVHGQSRMTITPFLIPEQLTGPESTIYTIAVGGSNADQKIPGKSLRDDCKTYEADTTMYPQLSIELRLVWFGSDKHFSGKKSWSSDGGNPGPAAEVRHSELNRKPFNEAEFKPSAGGNKFKYTVTWDITKN
jgi:hypothetical protein